VRVITIHLAHRTPTPNHPLSLQDREPKISWEITHRAVSTHSFREAYLSLSYLKEQIQTLKELAIIQNKLKVLSITQEIPILKKRKNRHLNQSPFFKTNKVTWGSSLLVEVSQGMKTTTII
jgi:hypothetical protein